MRREADLRSAAKAILRNASAPAKVFVFGSHARGEARSDSDVDLLVIESEVTDRFAEAAHLARVVGALRIPADVIVVSEQQVEEWGEVKGTLLHDALREGRLLAEA